MATASQLISKFVCNTDYNKIPSHVVIKAKASILDTIGVALAGFHEETSAIVRRYVEDMGGRPEATIFASDTKVPAANAALANGVASHVLDYDDASFEMLGHPSVVTLPTALAAGEAVGASGKDIITAYVLGVEVACRLGRALTSATYAAGWHNTGTLGTFAAAVAAGKLLGLDETQMAHAIGAAASMASGIKRNFGTSLKAYHAGQACANGLRSAALAKKGFVSAPDALEGKAGFVELFSKTFVVAELTQGLGGSYSIAMPGIAFKLYPSCAYTHGAIDAVLELRQNHGIDAMEVESIDCAAGAAAVDALPFEVPKTVLEAKFSMPYCLAIALCEGAAMLPQFADEKLGDPKLKPVMKKVALRRDDSIVKGYGDRAVEVRISLSDGRSFTKRVTNPRGDPSNPLTDSELLDKFRSCASRVLVGKSVSKSEELILSLDSVGDVSELLDSLIQPR